jgi:ornithine--oxo-acid transaminase
MATNTAPPPLTATADYSEHVNPQWVRLLDLLQMNVRYERCTGAELTAADGVTILDFLSGYCVHNTGHNHPEIIAAIKDELDRRGPAMLQSHVPELAGALARRLCALAGGGLNRAFFACSGSEGVESAIKFARKHTGRTGMLSAQGAFHGLTCGSLSLMDDPSWRDKFGPMLPDTATVPFNDIPALQKNLATRRYAAFFVEPVQAEAGIVVPDAHYLVEAERLCRKHGTLLVLDEVQTGMFRTGPFLAAHHFHVQPDMVVLAKALSGGLVPVSAVLMTEAICDSVYDSMKRAFVHTSTFSENALAMRAGLASLDVLEREGLGARAIAMGESLRERLRLRLAGYSMVKEVRGLGLLSGIVFQAPRELKLRIAFEAFQHIHPAMFGQVLVMRMFRDQHILTQICGNNFMVLKVAPPLVATTRQLDRFVDAIGAVLELMHSSGPFWTEALALARRAVIG